MKLLTLNFLTCAVKSCKSAPAAFPLRVRDAELERAELAYDGGAFLRGVLPRVEWEAMSVIITELGLPAPPDPATILSPAPAGASAVDVDMDSASTAPGASSTAHDASETNDAAAQQALKELHGLLLETQIVSGRLVCGNCGHEYAVREGIANFLLPAHLV